jgi:hypothetical protein
MESPLSRIPRSKFASAWDNKFVVEYSGQALSGSKHYDSFGSPDDTSHEGTKPTKWATQQRPCYCCLPGWSVDNLSRQNLPVRS